MRCWVFERVIGSPARNCTSAIDDPEFRSKLRALPLWMTPHLISSLDHSGEAILDTHGHGGEPLTWQADEHLFEECGLTRTPPTVNTAAVHQAVRKRGPEAERYHRRVRGLDRLSAIRRRTVLGDRRFHGNRATECRRLAGVARTATPRDVP